MESFRTVPGDSAFFPTQWFEGKSLVLWDTGTVLFDSFIQVIKSPLALESMRAVPDDSFITNQITMVLILESGDVPWYMDHI